MLVGAYPANGPELTPLAELPLAGANRNGPDSMSQEWPVWLQSLADGFCIVDVSALTMLGPFVSGLGIGFCGRF